MLRKLFTWTGVIPLTLFLAFHVGSYTALAFRNPGESKVLDLPDALVLVLEVLVLWLPLSVHAVLGVWLALGQEAPAAIRRSKRVALSRAVSGTELERWTGFLVLVFLGYHLFEFRVRLWSGELVEGDIVSELHRTLSSTGWGVPWCAIVYILGLAATAFHSALGIWRVLSGSPFAITHRGNRVVSYACGAWGLLLFTLGASAVVRIATGSALPF